ncbi:DUF2270 domain-containing protein [Balneolaceae bacterium YR4-1]|uniref:DUF2270 domain-containing protein n=1 Tax=Halalkalibaculum roseum TaxID=2709311 RepID=A0A6M1STD1_9BACT|nr:DUF2270 domain-containing protein [Halalkalibaculum roseum]NGP75368.1 DUF2270 domain-containing protein [Halalkalibaculum roseum]
MEEKKLAQSKAGFTGEAQTALVHFYRGEMDRMNTWRKRLDVTTNWAIITTAAFISFGFGSPQISHFVFILATIFVFIFLFIEARRYKYYDLWRWRVALVNENYFGPLLSGYKPVMSDWRDQLGSDLQHSRFKITFGEAFGRRLRRNYSWIFLILGGCWITKISIHPEPIVSVYDIVARAAIYDLVSGWVVILIGVLFNLGLIVFALLTLRDRNEEVKIYPSKRSKVKLSNL